MTKKVHVRTYCGTREAYHCDFERVETADDGTWGAMAYVNRTMATSAGIDHIVVTRDGSNISLIFRKIGGAWQEGIVG